MLSTTQTNGSSASALQLANRHYIPIDSMDNKSFDGRSFSIKPLPYSFWQRAVVIFSMNVMPLLTRLIMSHRLNTFLWRLLGCKVGKGSVIRMGTQINAPFKVTIGNFCSIHGHLKSRGGISIGNSVELVEEVFISTQSHNMDSDLFESIYAPVTISDFAWLGPRSMLLAGVSVGEGAVLAAGAIATNCLLPWSIYGGIPAKKIKSRQNLKQGE